MRHMDSYVMDVCDRLSPVTLCCVTLAVWLCCGAHTEASVLNLKRFIGCAVREFTFLARKPGCGGLHISTDACWGRCETWEVRLWTAFTKAREKSSCHTHLQCDEYLRWYKTVKEKILYKKDCNALKWLNRVLKWIKLIKLKPQIYYSVAKNDRLGDFAFNTDWSSQQGLKTIDYILERLFYISYIRVCICIIYCL